MNYPSYIKEAVEIVKFGFETSRSVDGFLIKLESAISHILEYGNESDIESFLDILVKRGLLSKLACNKGDVKKILGSPRHSLLRKYISFLEDALEKTPCIGGYKFTVPPPSKSAGHLSWGSSYRDDKYMPVHASLRKRQLYSTAKKFFVYFILICILLLLLYSGYVAYINLLNLRILNSKLFASFIKHLKF